MPPNTPTAADKAAADKAAAAQAAAAMLPVEVRVLTACAYGQANDVAVIPAGDLAAAKGDGLVDDEPAAVAYAKSLRG